MVEKQWEKVNVQRNAIHKRKYAVFYKLHTVQQKSWEMQII